MSRSRALLLALVLSCTLATTAHAITVPSPANSTVDPCLIVCPRGDVAFHVTVRDQIGAVVVGSSVIIEFCPAPSVRLCFPVTGCLVQGITDVTGYVAFAIQAGGITPPGTQIRVIADGVVLATRPVASPDQNGSLNVDGADVSIAMNKLGTVDPTTDFDCDQGVVDKADLILLQSHFNHVCDVPTPDDSRTWGRVKTMYR